MGQKHLGWEEPIQGEDEREEEVEVWGGERLGRLGI